MLSQYEVSGNAVRRQNQATRVNGGNRAGSGAVQERETKCAPGLALARLTAWTEAVDFDAVADHLVFGGEAHAAKDVFYVREVDVFRGAAADADQVVVVSLVAHSVADGAIAKDDAADKAVVEQELEGAVDGGAPDGGEVSSQLFRREVVFAPGDVLDDDAAGRRDLEALIAEFADETFSHRCCCHAP